MKMPGRYGNEDGKYRYGFNGMESDDEMFNQEGNSYTTMFRQYDPRIGKWFSLDPIIKPWESRYASFNNNPIFFTDPLGLDPPEKLNRLQQLGNWIAGNGYKNKANTYAVKNQIDESRIHETKNGIVIDETYYTSTKWISSDFEEEGLAYAVEYEVHQKETVFEDKVTFGAQFKGKVTVGPQLKVKTPVFKAGAGVAAELISFDYSYTDDEGWNDNNWDWIGADGTVWHTYAEAGMGLPIKTGKNGLNLGVNAFYKQSSRNHLGATDYGGWGEVISEDYGVTFGVPILKKYNDNWVTNQIKPITGQSMALKSSVKAEDNFIGVDLGAGAAFVFGVDIKIKVGWYYKD